MRIAVIITLLVALPAPTAAQDQAFETSARAAFVAREQTARELERQREQIERDLKRQVEQIERDRELQREQAEREREQQRQQAEQAREQAERERERAREQAERERAREQAERERERAREQAERERERARERDGSIQEIERTTRTFRIGANGELHLANISGDIVITRSTGSDAQIEIVKTARGRSSEDARELLSLVKVDIIERPNRAEIRTIYPQGDELRRNNRRNINVSVAFNVSVPAGTRVRANSISGSVSARDVRGDVVLKSISGAVRLINGGGATAESISGSIEVTDTSADGGVSASTASGSIMLRRVKARRVGANSISGNLVLEDVESPAVDAQTVSGGVQLNGALARNSRYELSSHSGSITVGVRSGTGFEVEATSFSGSVRSELPFDNTNVQPARGRFSRSLRGVVGDGSAVLELSTFSGSIAIVKR
jgi:DUF4097 and DUF4098 domain-containing protein YvlB/Skp family chaperone for outer membrane proteins